MAKDLCDLPNSGGAVKDYIDPEAREPRLRMTKPWLGLNLEKFLNESRKEKGPPMRPSFPQSNADYCSPALALLPHKALLPHNALLPQRAFDPHNALLPHRAFEPHNAFEPHRALLPHNALLPLNVVAGAPVLNWDDPQTAAFDHIEDVFHTALGLSLR